MHAEALAVAEGQLILDTFRPWTRIDGQAVLVGARGGHQCETSSDPLLRISRLTRGGEPSSRQLARFGAAGLGYVHRRHFEALLGEPHAIATLSVRRARFRRAGCDAPPKRGRRWAPLRTRSSPLRTSDSSTLRTSS